MTKLRWAMTGWYGVLSGGASLGVSHLGGLLWQWLFILPVFAGGIVLGLTWMQEPRR